MPTWQPRTTSPQATRGTPALYPGPLRGAHGTLKSSTRTMLSLVWICCPGLWSLSCKMWAQSLQTACHSPHSAACRAKGWGWRQVISHDFWQPPVERWWLCHSLSAIMTSQKVFPPLKRGRASDTIKGSLMRRGR